MPTMQQLVVGVFGDRAQAERAIHDLLQAGFAHDQIRFVGHGGPTGGLLERIKSLFTGQDTSPSGIVQDLVKMGVSPEDARYYQSEYEAGHSIVAVLARERIEEATSILIRHGGYGAATRRMAGTAASGTAASMPETATEEKPRLTLREEELQVRKQPVETGEVRVHKEVVTERKSIDVPVSHEEVYIERLPGSGQPSDIPIGASESYRIPVHEEQITVEKRPVEREEIVFEKQPVQEIKRVTDTVKREEARAERAGDVDIHVREPQDVDERPDDMNIWGRDVGRKPEQP
jgi:uncharacterized protein (TIGR02271 family)